jgi:transposase
METQSSPTAACTAWAGIDVSKDTLDLCLIRTVGKPQHQQFANDAAGHVKLLRWVMQRSAGQLCHFCLESTGAYSQAIALFLAERQQRVSVVNPARTKYAALAQGSGNKTDRTDARVIAEYCRSHHPPLWRMAAPEVQVLRALVRRLHDLQDLSLQEQNRLAQPGLPDAVETSLRQSVAFLQQQIAAVQQQIIQHIDSTPSLKADRDLLVSIPAVSQKTAQEILAALPDVRQFDSAESVAAFAGLAPQEYRSGSSVRKRTRLSKQGPPALRKALYWPAIVACRRNPLVKALYERLRDAGKSKMVAIGAAMRKLLMIAYGVLKNRTTFTIDPQRSPRAAT